MPAFLIPYAIAALVGVFGGYEIKSWVDAAQFRHYEQERLEREKADIAALSAAVRRAEEFAEKSIALNAELEKSHVENRKKLEAAKTSVHALMADRLRRAAAACSPMPQDSSPSGVGNGSGSAANGQFLQGVAGLAERFAERGDALSEQLRVCQDWADGVLGEINSQTLK